MTPSVSSLYWLPRIQVAGLPIPRTMVVPFAYRELTQIFDGISSPEFLRLLASVEDAAAGVIGFPAFFRTDVSSAKHAGPRAYLARTRDDIGQLVFATMEDHEMKFMVGPDPRAFLVREFLDLDSPFTAFRGMPINREWRIFADCERVICEHPYWPAEAIETKHGLPADWRELLAELHEPPAEMCDLRLMAVRAAMALDGKAWSVDFARDRAGKWWLIDMAPMAVSWHWPGCPTSVEGK